MRNSQDVLGLPVVAVSSGKEVGVVRDLLFDNSQRLLGILVESKGWIGKRRCIPAGRVTSFGSDAVTIHSEDASEPLKSEHDEAVGVCSGKRQLRGLPVMTATGRELGRLQNVYFLEEMGTLVGYELTDGFLNDLREGRQTLRTTERLTWGDDALIVPEGAEAELSSDADRK